MSFNPGSNNKKPSKNPIDSRAHPDYLKESKLVPKNFDMPEKPIHGKIVHSQLRDDLFKITYAKVRFS